MYLKKGRKTEGLFQIFLSTQLLTLRIKKHVSEAFIG
jgi:hypothetical protein